MLVCALYMDLNLIKAGEAVSLHSSRYTSAYQRIMAKRSVPTVRIERMAGWES